MDAKKPELVELRSVLLRIFFFLSFFDPSSWLFISLSLPSLAGLSYLPRQPFFSTSDDSIYDISSPPPLLSLLLFLYIVSSLSFSFS